MTTRMRLVLPYPPALNALYRNMAQVTRSMMGKIYAQIAAKGQAWIPGRVLKSAEHREYLKLAHASLELEAASLGLVFPFFAAGVPLALELQVYRPRAGDPTSPNAGDIDRSFKALFDAANGKVWADDSQIVHLATTKQLDRENPRVELTVQVVERLNAGQPSSGILDPLQMVFS